MYFPSHITSPETNVAFHPVHHPVNGLSTKCPTEALILQSGSQHLRNIVFIIT